MGAEFELRPVELRAEAGRRQITGTVMRYGEQATVLAPGGRVLQETFDPGAFAGYLAEFRTVVNLMHDRAVTVAATGGE